MTKEMTKELLSNISLGELFDFFRDEGFSIRVVGGAVRDLFLGEKPSDIDLCTTATPEQMTIIGKRNNIPVIPTGIDHGTVTFVFNDVDKFEVTTLRKDMDCDGRRATVEFTDDFKEDAARRDFTFNAMMMDEDGNIFDFFDGKDDLENGIVRFIGDPNLRIQEDYLRILRWFRFYGRYGESTLGNDAIGRNVSGLKDVSAERIWTEIRKILMTNRNLIDIFIMMEQTGVDKIIGLPTVNLVNIGLPALFTDDPIFNLATMFFVRNGVCSSLAKRWKFSNEDTKKFEWVTLRFMLIDAYSDEVDNVLKADLVDGVDRDWVVTFADIVDGYRINSITTDFANWDIPVMPVTGSDLLELGFTEGKAVGNSLSVMKNIWKRSDYTMGKDELLEFRNS